MSGQTDAALARAQRRLWLVTIGAAGVGLAAMAILISGIDARLNQARLDAGLKGRAARGAALMFFDAHGRLQTSGIRGDEVTEGGPLLIYSRTHAGVRLVAGGPAPAGAAALARTALSDGAERGSYANLTKGNMRLRAAAMPFFRSDTARIAGAVLAATSVAATVAEHDRLKLAVWGAALGLLLGAALLAWWLARRSVRPLGLALEREQRFLAAAAHELRTPVARMLAVAEAAQRAHRADRPEELSQELSRLVLVAGQSRDSVETLLTFAQIDAGRRPVAAAPVRLDTLASDLELDDPGLVADIDGPVEISGDHELLHRALAELILNARRHGRAQTPVQLAVRRENHQAVVTVRNDGLGFDPAVLLTALEPFSSGPRSPGSGLGLWIVDWIARSHGGQLTLHDGGAAGGAMVELRFPIYQPEVLSGHVRRPST